MGTSADLDLEYEPDTAFGPWYLYDDDSVQLVQQPRAGSRFSPEAASPEGAAGGNSGSGPGAAAGGDVDDLIKSNQAYILFYRLRNEI